MTQRVEPDKDGDTGPARTDLDRKLSVTRWQVPGKINKFADVKVEAGAPSWWAGDEEASQTSLAAMRAMGAKV